MEKTNYKIVRANTLQELEEAFACGLIQLYQDIFSEPPYEERFSSESVAQTFTSYFNHDVDNRILVFAYLGGEVVAFCAAVALNGKWLDFEIVSENSNTSRDCYRYFQETFNSTSDNTWYLDDLGVRKDQRRKGLAKCLLQICLTTLGSVDVFLRTSDSNSSAHLLYQKVGFSPIDGLFVLVSQERQDGTTRIDRRIIMMRRAE
jgi:ribosomal protein S18 acetylase RimI-like enzyme